MCPSSRWNHEHARVFGVVGGDAHAPKVMFLKQLLVPSKELEAKLGDVTPEEVYRVAAPCSGSKCGHHNADTKGCKLVEKIVDTVAPVVDDYAVCLIRANCVWWEQEGVNACLRCPQIATNNRWRSKEITRASNPNSDVRSGAPE